MTYEVGDRVRVFPQSKAHERLRGTAGTVEHVERGHPFDGALRVLLDATGDTIGIGSECVRREPVAEPKESHDA